MNFSRSQLEVMERSIRHNIWMTIIRRETEPGRYFDRMYLNGKLRASA